MVFVNYGGVAEWLKAADCKSARIAYVGSNPTPTTIMQLNLSLVLIKIINLIKRVNNLNFDIERGYYVQRKI